MMLRQYLVLFSQLNHLLLKALETRPSFDELPPGDSNAISVPPAKPATSVPSVKTATSVPQAKAATSVRPNQSLTKATVDCDVENLEKIKANLLKFESKLNNFCQTDDIVEPVREVIEPTPKIEINDTITTKEQPARAKVKKDSQKVCNSAVEKLSSIKIYDKNEEVRKKARADMPNLKLVPLKVSKVIVNNLDSNKMKNKVNSVNSKYIEAEPIKIGDNLDSNKLKNNINSVNSKYIEAKPIKVGDICVFSHIESPSEFYLQAIKEENCLTMDMIDASLNKKFSKTQQEFQTKDEAFYQLGNYACGYVWDNGMSWYRVQIIDWQLGFNTPEVYAFSVDYGFKCKISFMFLRKLPLDLVNIPALAVKCHFPLLYHKSSTYTNRIRQWPENVVNALKLIANSSTGKSIENIKIFEVIFALIENDSLGVDLVPYGHPNADSIGTTLIDTNLAVEITDEYENHGELGDFLEDLNECDKAENLNELITGYDAKDETRVCRFTRKDGSCFKGRNCRMEHYLLKDGYTTDKCPVAIDSVTKLTLLNIGDTVTVLMTSFINSCTYMVQIIKEQRIYNGDVIMDSDMLQLVQNMNRPKTIRKYLQFKVLPALGEIIIAYHAIEKKWLRATVCDYYENKNELLVYSVDFAEEFEVTMDNIRIMQDAFMHLPFQAIKVYLFDCQPIENCDTQKARTFFNQYMVNRTFVAKIMSNEEPYKVSISTVKKRTNIGPTLIKEGLAEPRTTDCKISDNLKISKNLGVE
ncbi:hypothetical protein ABEB36_009787 [Hypothenemus hampei]